MSARPFDPWPGCETLAYQSPDGETLTMLMLTGTTGRMMPPATVTTVAVPAGNGSRYLGSYHAERAVAVPVVIPGSLTDRDTLRDWARILDPTRGEGTLSVVQGAWAGRQLSCVYETGLDTFSEASGDLNTGTLVFRAAWPYWSDGLEQEIDVAQNVSAYHTWFPFLPLVLGASSAFAVFNIDNIGDVAAWPIVRATGPGVDLTVTNTTTGYTWQVAGTIPAGQILEVDTRPGAKSVELDGANAFYQLTPDSALWPLAPGVNNVSVALASSTGASLIRFVWRNEWLAA